VSTADAAPDLDALREITDAIEALRHDVSGMASELGHETVAAHLGDDVGGQPDAESVYVVVVGEKKRGKSSLINALVGEEGLLPVDIDVATSCYIAVRHGPERTATVFSDECPEGCAIDPADIAEWASVEGNVDPSDPDRVLHEGVRGVEVTVTDSGLADGVVLVDTPGVGGLEAGHTDLTIAALARADALLFVIDPGGPLTAPELRFLERAARRIATVVFVLTKTDMYPGWRQVLDDDRALIARHAPRFSGAAWIPTSAVLASDAVAARRDGDLSRATALQEQSGLDDLVQILDGELAGGANRLRLENRLQAVASAVTELAIGEQQRVRAATGDAGLLDELEAQERSVAALAGEAATWVDDVNRGFVDVTSTLQLAFQRAMRDARRALEDDVQVWRTANIDTFTGEVDAVLRAQWASLEEQRRRLTGTLVAQLARQMADDGFDGLASELPYPERLASLPPLRQRPPDEQTAAEYLPVIGAGMVVRTLGAQFLPAILGGPIGLLVGAGLGLVLNTRRKERQQLAEAKIDAARYVTRVFEEATAEMSAALRDAIAEDQRRIRKLVDDLLEQRRHDLERQVAAAREAVDADQSTQAAIRADAQRRIARLKELAQAGLALSARFTALAIEGADVAETATIGGMG
jgi:hypothetical protein